jgi:tetratricopeptide (TPR) repeat protein
MKRHLVVGTLVIGFLGISLLFVPRNAELNLMHMKSRQFDLARVAYEKQFATGDRSVSVSAPLVDLYTYFGDIDKAIAVIESFLEAHPKDYTARQMLAQLYWDEQRTDDYLIQLEKLTRQRPSEEGLRKLYTLYNEKARPDQQLRSLTRLVNRYPGKMDDYVTLAYLQAGDGKITDALKTLETLDVKHPASASSEKEELHISLYLDAGKPERAKDRAVRWLNRNFDAIVFARFLDVFKSREREPLSLQLLHNFETAVEQDATLLRLLVEMETQSGKNKDAFKRLVRLFRSDRLPDSLALNLIELMMEPNNPTKANKISPAKTVQAPPQFEPGKPQLTKANQKLAREVLKKYGEAVLSPRPLLAARLMFALKNETAALAWIQTAENLPLLTIDQQIELAGLYGKLGRTGQLNTAKLRNRILRELQSPSLPESRREELVFAMLELKGHRQALPYLKQLAYRRGGDWIYPYEETLVKLGRQQEIVDFWRMRVKQSGLPDEEKRQLAFQLLEVNNKDDAEIVFRELAANSTANSPDVEQLLFLWGPRPGPDARKWLLERAQKSTGNERAEWMQHLIQTGGAQEAIQLAGSHPPKEITNKLFSAYLLALGELGDATEFATATLRMLESETNPDRLFAYGTLAEDREQLDVALTADQKILTVRPDEIRALRRLGRIFFQQNRWQDAQLFLQRLLDKNKQDWEANYYYAEAGFLQGKKAESMPFYEQVLKSIGNKPSLSMKMARANSLHRLGRNDEALAVFERLFKERPDDKEIRASIVSALIETGNFAKAQQLMISNN